MEHGSPNRNAYKIDDSGLIKQSAPDKKDNKNSKQKTGSRYTQKIIYTLPDSGSYWSTAQGTVQFLNPSFKPGT